MEIDYTKIGYRWKGDYSSTATYVNGDVTRKDGGAYAYNGSTWVKHVEDQQNGRALGEILTPDDTSVVSGIVDQTLEINGLGMPEFAFPTDNPRRVGVAKLPKMDYADNSGNGCVKQMYFIMSDGSLMGVGRTIYGALGGKTRADQNTNRPTQIHFPAGAGRIVDVYPQNYTCHAIDHLGQLWGWGYNNYGQVGRGVLVVQYTPVLINGQGDLPADAKVTDVYMNNSEAAAHARIFRTDDGKMYWTGKNRQSVAGTQTNNSGDYNITSPTLMVKSAEVPMVKAYLGMGDYMVSVLQDSAGRMYILGEYNSAGNYVKSIADWRVAKHTLISQTAIYPAKDFVCHGSYNVASGSGEYRTAVILFENGEIMHWGGNESGYGTTPRVWNPAGMISDGRTNGSNWKQVTCWNGNTPTLMGIKNDGSMWYMGYLNGSGTGGTAATVGSIANVWTRLTEFGYNNKKLVSQGINSGRFWMVEKTNGSFMVGGFNLKGVAGNGTILNGYRGNEYDTLMRLNKPIKEWVVGGYNQNASSFNTWYGLGYDGNVYSTGYDDYGQLGREDEQEYATTPSPVKF